MVKDNEGNIDGLDYQSLCVIAIQQLIALKKEHELLRQAHEIFKEEMNQKMNNILDNKNNK